MTRPIHRNALHEGGSLLWYRIEHILGQGGFDITYLALDTNLDQQVVIKEYLPMELAVREGDQSVHPVSQGHEDDYQWGLERFIAEARTLAKFDHPNIVRMLSVFAANNMAYRVMRYEQGRYSGRFLLAIDQALQFREADRPQSLDEWAQLFEVPAVDPEAETALAARVALAAGPGLENATTGEVTAGTRPRAVTEPLTGAVEAEETATPEADRDPGTDELQWLIGPRRPYYQSRFEQFARGGKRLPLSWNWPAGSGTDEQGQTGGPEQGSQKRHPLSATGPATGSGQPGIEKLNTRLNSIKKRSRNFKKPKEKD